MRSTVVVLTIALALLARAATAQQAPKVDPALVDKIVKDTFKGASPEWQARIVADEAQRLCSQSNGSPSAADAKRLSDSAAANIVYPADGNVIGDWKKGQQLAQRGTGGQFSDKADTPKGANCYACHQLSRAELSFGTLGPSLLEYGAIRKFKPEEAKAAYAKIYNAQAVQACSNMPRFGHSKFLTEPEMKDLTAYLFDPASPVNK
jgi:L-cysteine S-thiosulfotransferase